jgi:Tfp pilus assembly protein PilO
MTNPKNLILIVLAIGLFYTFGSPQYQEVKTLQASANEYQDVIENVSRIAAARDALLVEYESIPAIERDKLLKVLPNNVDSVRLALDLDTIAGRYGIAIKDVSVDAKADPNAALAVLPDNKLPYEKAVVTFSFVSNYENFVRLLSDLEKSLRIMDIKSVSFRVAPNGLYEHELQVETYWLK